jgi:hypothetical protein
VRHNFCLFEIRNRKIQFDSPEPRQGQGGCFRLCNPLRFRLDLRLVLGQVDGDGLGDGFGGRRRSASLEDLCEIGEESAVALSPAGLAKQTQETQQHEALCWRIHFQFGRVSLKGF